GACERNGKSSRGQRSFSPEPTATACGAKTSVAAGSGLNEERQNSGLWPRDKAATARRESHVTTTATLPPLGLGQIAEVVFDGLTMARVEAAGQLLNRLGLLARLHSSPAFHELTHLGRVYRASAAVV